MVQLWTHEQQIASHMFIYLALIGWTLGFAMADVAGKTGLKGVACGLWGLEPYSTAIDFSYGFVGAYTVSVFPFLHFSFLCLWYPSYWVTASMSCRQMHNALLDLEEETLTVNCFALYYCEALSQREEMVLWGLCRVQQEFFSQAHLWLFYALFFETNVAGNTTLWCDGQ